MRLLRRLFGRGARAGASVAEATETLTHAGDMLAGPAASPAGGVTDRPAVTPPPAPDSLPYHSESASLPVPEQLAERVAAACTRLTSNLPRGTSGDDMRRVLDALGGELSGVIRQLPSAAQEALALCNAGDVSQAELTALVERDPMLTQALLQAANSAYYQRAGQAPVVAIRSAIERIGLAGLRSVLLRVTVSGLLCRPGGAFGSMVTQVWEHMVRTAPYARRLAPAYGVVPETAYTLGLLHDVGKLVIFDTVATVRAQLRRDLVVEREQVGHLLRALHEPLGGAAAIRWGLGDDAALAIASHHRAPPPAMKLPMSEVLFLAERADLADVRDLPFDMEVIWRDGAITASGARVVALLTEERSVAAPAAA